MERSLGDIRMAKAWRLLVGMCCVSILVCVVHQFADAPSTNSITGATSGGNEPASSSPSLPLPVDNFVVFSATLDARARKEDYDFLAAPTALNWHFAGFRPIILAVASSASRIKTVRSLWNILLPKEAIVVPIIVPQNASILVAQVSRLFVASMMHNELNRESFLRVTDADMFVMDAKPFDPPREGIDIDIYNGRCCLGGQNAMIGREKKCNQYPMHSVGMKVGLWRNLFNMSGSVADHVSNIVALAADKFGFQHAPILHGGEKWFTDQVLLGCTIDDAMESGHRIILSPGPGSKRLHLSTSPERAIQNYRQYFDAHLAGFSLERHLGWLQKLVNASTLLGNNHTADFQRYSEAWKAFKDGVT